MTSMRETDRTPTTFTIIVGRTHFEAWAQGSRWFYHRKVNGRITDDASYASRGSCRRAILTRIDRGDV